MLPDLATGTHVSVLLISARLDEILGEAVKGELPRGSAEVQLGIRESGVHLAQLAPVQRQTHLQRKILGTTVPIFHVTETFLKTPPARARRADTDWRQALEHADSKRG